MPLYKCKPNPKLIHQCLQYNLPYLLTLILHQSFLYPLHIPPTSKFSLPLPDKQPIHLPAQLHRAI